MRTVTYVKTGLPGYGPDLDENDHGVDPDDVRAIADIIRDELSNLADYLHEGASNMADAELWEDAYKARVKADELDTLRASLDWEHRQDAPLYAHGHAALDDTLRRIIADTFPLDIDDQIRLYVWDAEGDDDA